MSVMKGKAKEHWRVAQLVFAHVYDTVAGQPADDKFERMGAAIKRLDSQYSIVKPAMKAICNSCMLELGIVKKNKVGDERRKNFLSRLFVANVLEVVPGISAGDRRKFVSGMNHGLEFLFTEKERETLNRYARIVYEYCGNPSDGDFLPAIGQSEVSALMNQRILFNFVRRFRNFNHQRVAYCSNIARHLMEQGGARSYQFDEVMFDEIFRVSLARIGISPLTVDHDEFNVVYGEEEYDKISGIKARYEVWSKQLEVKRTLNAHSARAIARLRRNSF